MSEDIERAKTLLKAAHDILRKSDESRYVVNALEIVTTYDEAECDGHCLGQDIEHWFEDHTETPIKQHFS